MRQPLPALLAAATAMSAAPRSWAMIGRRASPGASRVLGFAPPRAFGGSGICGGRLAGRGGGRAGGCCRCGGFHASSAHHVAYGVRAVAWHSSGCTRGGLVRLRRRRLELGANPRAGARSRSALVFRTRTGARQRGRSRSSRCGGRRRIVVPAGSEKTDCLLKNGKRPRLYRRVP